MNLIRPKAPRFYRDVNGVVEACYKVPVKNKKFLMDEGHPGTKEPTIADARELGLLPSVTTILGVLAKPGLERWKLEQAIHSTLTLPREAGEGEDAFARRVVQDMDAQAAKAAEFGTRIHDAIAAMMTALMHWKASLKEFQIGFHPDIAPYLQSFIPWALDNIEEVHAVEKVVGGKHCGYAGRLDLDCTLRGVGRCVVDFKTTQVKDGKEPKFWPEWPKQLAAYREAAFPEDAIWDRKTPKPRLVSIVIDSAKPGPIWPKVWDESVWDYFALFEGNLKEWIYQHNYDPTIEA